MARNRKPSEGQTLGKMMTWFQTDTSGNQDFLDKVDKRYRAYRAVIDVRSDAAGWTSKQHPAYVLQIIETVVANLIEPKPRFKVRARPRMDVDWHKSQQGAQMLELLLAQQADDDRLSEKQAPFAKQALITGLSVYKTSWDFQTQNKTRRKYVDQPLHGEDGAYLANVELPVNVEAQETVRDDPTAEVVDVRDFFWHEAAVSLDKARRVHHRIWVSMDELNRLQKQGIYENVDRLGPDTESPEGFSDREMELFKTNRSKGMVEVVETWWRRPDGGIQVTAVANRGVVIRDTPNPFWHGQYPFVVCSAMPDMFRIPGVSMVEIVADLQEMLWTLINQRLDSVRLLNNAITLIRSDVYDADQFEWYPGAQWMVDDPDQVKMLEHSMVPAQVSIQAEGMLKGDMQSVTGGMPFLSGADSQSIDQQTATGVSIVTSLAQKRLASQKMMFSWAYKRVAEQWTWLNQQFLTDSRLVQQVGPRGAPLVREVLPQEIVSGDYYVEEEEMEESLMRQEKRAEAQAALQMALNATPVIAQLAQAGAAKMINIDAFVEDFLDAFGIKDTERYFTEMKPPPPQNPQQAPSPNGNGGTTNPELAAGVMSPSNQVSQSPVAGLQRMGAMSGGAANG